LNKTAVRVAIFLAVPILVAYATLMVMQTLFTSPADPADRTVALFEIPRGRTFVQICTDLQDKGLIRRAWIMNVIAGFRKIDRTKIQAGEYELSRSMTPAAILEKLVSGEVLKRSVLIPEGTSIWEIGERLEKEGIISKEEFNKGLSDRQLLVEAGIQGNSFEGYLFPETYTFSRPVTVKEILWTLLSEGEKRWKKEYTDQMDKLRMSRHQVLTLASIIEKESGNTDEQPLISAVFHNRLKQNMPLQADPTVIYGLPNFDGNLTREHLEMDTPYNTYVHNGLPPGPICNPGDTAIHAALFPKETPYLYFVADGRGGHTFSVTLDEHNKAVKQLTKATTGAAAGK
jgi:UPF0755 protein